MKKLIFITAILLFILTACQSGPRLEEAATAQDNPEENVPELVKTEEVVSGQVKPEDIVLAQVVPLNHGDINAALELYSEDVELQLAPTFALLPGSPDHYRGKDELRVYFESLIESHIQLQIDVQQVEGNTVTTNTYTWMDLTRDLDIAPLEATEVYTIQDGRIKSWTWTLSEESLEKLKDPLPVFAITFQKDSCIYNGPKSVEFPAAIIVWNDVSDVQRAEYYVVVEMFDEGKTLEERVEYTGFGPPEWTTVIGFDKSSSASYQYFTPLLNDGPIYLVCLVTEEGGTTQVLDAVGPIMIDWIR